VTFVGNQLELNVNFVGEISVKTVQGISAKRILLLNTRKLGFISREVQDTLMMQGKQLIWMTERYGLIELHFQGCVVTVDIKHFSFTEKVKR